MDQHLPNDIKIEFMYIFLTVSMYYIGSQNMSSEAGKVFQTLQDFKNKLDKLQGSKAA